MKAGGKSDHTIVFETLKAHVEGFNSFGFVKLKLNESCNGERYPPSRLVTAIKKASNGFKLPMALAAWIINQDVYRWRVELQQQMEDAKLLEAHEQAI